MSLVQPANKLRACLQYHGNGFIRMCHYASGSGSSVTDGCCEEACSASDKGDTPHHSAYVKSSTDQSQLSPTPQPLLSSCPDTRSDSRMTEQSLSVQHYGERNTCTWMLLCNVSGPDLWRLPLPQRCRFQVKHGYKTYLNPNAGITVFKGKETPSQYSHLSLLSGRDLPPLPLGKGLNKQAKE